MSAFSFSVFFLALRIFQPIRAEPPINTITKTTHIINRVVALVFFSCPSLSDVLISESEVMNVVVVMSLVHVVLACCVMYTCCELKGSLCFAKHSGASPSCQNE